MTSSHKPGMIVLHTKLYRPGVPKSLIARPRLFAKLDAGLDGPLTLVTAPAGFGKTALVSSWLQALDKDPDSSWISAWLTLDERDKDRDVFLKYFVAALRTIFPEACTETLDLLNAQRQVPTRILLNTLSNEIDALPRRFVMVMDDLHTAHGQSMSDTLNQWFQHWPRQMHLVLISRFNPPLPLTSLRAKGFLTEIRSSDLRFSRAEADEYFSHALRLPLDELTLGLLQERLEGWIAGLKIAMLFLGEQKSINDLVATLLDHDTTFITDYLIKEVIADQPPQIQRFLLKMSILNQFSVSLAEALMDDDDGEYNAQECIDYIKTADLFLIQLDKQQEWYRFHHLFRDALRQKLSGTMPASQIKKMHARIADWFFAHNLSDQAIYHAMEASDLERATSYMEQTLCDILNREDRAALQDRLQLIPEELIAKSPSLLVMRAYLYAFRWEIGRMIQATRQAIALIDKNDPSESTQILLALTGVLEGSAYYDSNQYDQVISNNGRVLSELPVQWQYARGIAASYIGMGMHAAGRPEAAQQFLSGQYESYRDKGDSYALRILMAVAINHIQSGNYENAERTAHTILRQADQSHLPVMKGWGYYLLGFLNYEWNELKKAADYFDRAIDLFYTTQLAVVRNSMMGQAWTCQALGRPTEALQIISRLSDLDLEVSGYEQIDTTAARAQLSLMSGDNETAEQWVDMNISGLKDQSLLIWMGRPRLTKACILLARNKGADTKTALQILDTVGQLAERTVNIRITIEVLALRSLALLNLGDNAGARDTLIRSVELARRGSFTRTFVDKGPQMQKLLGRIAGHGSVSKSVSRILAAFPQPEATGRPVPQFLQLPASIRANDSDDEELLEHLTQRELEILLLMAEPISFRDIASRMNISYSTARRYTINVYSKFDVHSRWEAVNSAIHKGIIPPR